MAGYRRDNKGPWAAMFLLKAVFLANAANMNLHIWFMIYLAEQMIELYFT